MYMKNKNYTYNFNELKELKWTNKSDMNEWLDLAQKWIVDFFLEQLAWRT